MAKQKKVLNEVAYDDVKIDENSTLVDKASEEKEDVSKNNKKDNSKIVEELDSLRLEYDLAVRKDSLSPRQFEELRRRINLLESQL